MKALKYILNNIVVAALVNIFSPEEGFVIFGIGSATAAEGFSLEGIKKYISSITVKTWAIAFMIFVIWYFIIIIVRRYRNIKSMNVLHKIGALRIQLGDKCVEQYAIINIKE